MQRGDAGEVEAGDEGEEAEDEELEVRIGGLGGVVEPEAEAGLEELLGFLGLHALPPATWIRRRGRFWARRPFA
ncbi:hypothetical protein RchiOBHm_Chr2g0112351 [Rosa chinensis]|uniref:Uncharacterized protein n=1 Tax=Rosa chinensis TaxID=74649 RepID=A0A2P6RQ90_ROSCH|nr:hypothetical protein RchiOBHm_Chr2g0112351 [Rosa chinensis]